MSKRVIIIPVLLTFIGLYSCQNNTKELDYNPIVLASKDYVLAEDGVFEIVNAFFKGIHDTAVINSGFGYIDACGVLYYPSGDSMKFDYGDVNRLCQDNKFRRGMFKANFTGPVFNEGIIANIATVDLLVDDLPVELTMSIENLGLNNSNYPEFSAKVTSSIFIHPDTAKISDIRYITDYQMVWTEGFQTPEIHEDDTFLISGTSSGISSDLYEFSVVIEEPLVNYLDCFWITDGISRITIPAGDVTDGNVDYILEDGCNNIIHLYFNGELFYHVIK